MRISGIYKIVNKINGKYYVGCSNNIYKRWEEHKRFLINGKHHNSHLQKSWNKYGESNFDFILMESIIIDLLKITEQKYLDIAKLERHNCYNSSFISDKIEMTDETKRKIGLSALGHKRNLGRKYEPITAQKRAISRRSNGKPWITESTKIKIGLSNKGKPRHTIESIRSMREKLKGRKPNNLDSTIIRFKNQKTNEEFTGTKNEFIKKFNLLKQPVYAIINGNTRLKSYKGWTVNR